MARSSRSPSSTASRQGSVPAAGSSQLADGWIAIAATEAAQLQALYAVAGANGPDVVAGALALRQCDEVLKALDSQGVPAERVREAQRYPFFDDPGNQKAGLVAQYTHAEWGAMEQPGAMWYFGDLDVRLEYAPPVLGEHTVEVLTDAGLTRAEIERLIADGVALAR